MTRLKLYAPLRGSRKHKFQFYKNIIPSGLDGSKKIIPKGWWDSRIEEIKNKSRRDDIIYFVEENMAGTYSQIYIQIVFAVQGRQNLLQKEWRDEVFKYIAGIIKNKGQKPIIVNGVEDHAHVFIGLKPSMTLSDLVRDIKNNLSNFINTHTWIKGKFNWQEGYGAFSYSHSQIENVYDYILNQEKHHAKQTFKDEYLDFFKKFEIEHDVKYLFEWVE